MDRRSFVFLTILFLLPTVFCGQFITFTYSGRANKLFIPSAYKQGTALPLYVMLHGCTQNPTDFATGTKMNEYGDKFNLLVLYPEQTSSANANKCWNWFEASSQSRGSGETALIAGMVASVGQSYTVDKNQIFVGGLSAGAAMSVIMGATYPDVFSGVAVGAGLEYKAATSMVSAFTAMSSGGPDPTTQGDVAYKAQGSYSRPLAVLVVHGTSDYTVALVNGNQVATSWARTNDKSVGNGVANGYVSGTPSYTENGQVPGGRAYEVAVYENSQTGQTIMKYVKVTGMAHAWSGGSSSGTYTDSTGPDASLMMIELFSQFVNNGTSTTTSGTTSATTSDSTGTSTSTTTSTSTSTTGGPTDSVVFYAVASETGYVGQIYLDGFSADTAKVGDKGMYNVDTYRTILSFDTSALLSNETIKSVALKLCRKSLTGTVKYMSVDIKAGSFGGSNALSQSKYSAVSSALDVLQLDVPAGDGSCVTGNLPASALQYVKNEGANGRTQFRVKGSTSASFAANTLVLYGGEEESSQYAPALIVNYN